MNNSANDVSLPFPNPTSDDARSIVKGLLERKVVNRLGCGPRGAEEIKVGALLSDLSCFDFFLSRLKWTTCPQLVHVWNTAVVYMPPSPTIARIASHPSGHGCISRLPPKI